MIVILDDIKFDSIIDLLPGMTQGDGWFEFGQYKCIDQILDIARKYFDLSEAIGYEMHKNLKGPRYHYDKDEQLYATQKILSFPLCGIVYYPKIENMQGGDLAFDNVMLLPITNRLVIFSPELAHGVNNFSGTRISIGINPWKEKPLAYR
jgi:hypothetical protein